MLLRLSTPPLSYEEDGARSDGICGRGSQQGRSQAPRRQRRDVGRLCHGCPGCDGRERAESDVDAGAGTRVCPAFEQADVYDGNVGRSSALSVEIGNRMR